MNFRFLIHPSSFRLHPCPRGGFDIRASKRVSFRATMDYNPVFVGDSNSGTRDLVRFSAGLLFR